MIANSATLREELVKLFDNHKAEVQNYQWKERETEKVFPEENHPWILEKVGGDPVNSPSDKYIIYQSAETDLDRGFGKVRMKINVTVTVRRADMKVVGVVVKGTQWDLYDFTYNIDRLSACVQAGYPSLSERTGKKAGHPFRTRVDLDNKLSNLPEYSFAP
jgi:hypothetical protein